LTTVVVELRGCTRDYGPLRAVDALDLTVVEGEFLALLGPSGCGKTTTLNLIAGFVEPTAGRVLIDGKDVTGRPPHLRGLGVVFQSYALFPHLSVQENVAFGLRERRVPASEIERRVGDALELVRLDRQGRQRPGELSGGMQQRVALARALVYRPRVLLLDEPLAALDRKLREGMRDELRAIQRSLGVTTVFVTHDQAEALGLADRIAVMNRGRIEQLGSPREIYERPAVLTVAQFVGHANFIEGRLEAGGASAACASSMLAGDWRLDGRAGAQIVPGSPVIGVLRYEKLVLGDKGLPATLQEAAYLGPTVRVTVKLEGGRSLIAELPSTEANVSLTPGAQVRVSWAPDNLVILPA
jgi:putative spermidine/putrescine transport system ATP-binding protein